VTQICEASASITAAAKPVLSSGDVIVSGS
jgi:hypothetical protein